MSVEMLARYKSERFAQKMLYSGMFRDLKMEGHALIEMMTESVLSYFDSICARRYLTLHDKLGHLDEKLCKAILDAVPFDIKNSSPEHVKLDVIRHPETLRKYEDSLKLAEKRAEDYIATVVGHILLNPPQEDEDFFDTREAKDGDLVTYFSRYNEISTGVVKGDNPHKEGVDVYGTDWRQYAGKWFILKVERDGKVIYQKKGLEYLVQSTT